jgi:hypothetical protein
MLKKDSFVLVESVLSCLAALHAFFQTRDDNALEILALRQQVAVLKRKRCGPIEPVGPDLLDCPPPLLVPLD